MKKLCVFTLYPELGASSMYRIFLYKDGLQSKFNVKWFPFWNEAYVKKYMYNKKRYFFLIAFFYLIALVKRLYQLLFIASKSDVCFFQKACIPKFCYNNLPSLKKKGIRIIFDVDDAIYLEKRDFSNKIAELSDVVVCGNESLCRYYKTYNKNVMILPTVECTYLYQQYWKNTYENKTIGWIGSLSTIDNLDLIVKPINNIIEKYPKVNFLIISNSTLDYDKKIKNCRFVEWNRNSYMSELSNITIGIMPLKNNEGNRGKCGFKLIQYLNMKKPVVGSNVGVNSKIIGNCGFSVESENEWENALEMLLFNSKEYSKCMNNIEKEFFPNYSYESVLKKLINVIDS